MANGGSISVQTVRGFVALAQVQGLDVGATLESAGTARILEDPDGRVPWQACEQITLSIAGQIGMTGMMRAMMGLRGRFSVLYYVARHSQTVGTALRRVAEHYRLTSTLGHCELSESREVACLRLTQREYLSLPFRRVVSALWAVSNVVVMRQLTNRDFRPTEVGLEIPQPADRAELELYHEALRCPLTFEAMSSTIVFPPSVLAEQVMGADPVIEAALDRYVAELAARLPGDGTAAGVRRTLIGGVGFGDPDVRTVAYRLGTTPRTLQRRLHTEGTSFQQVLDGVRRETAIAHIRERHTSIDEIAFLLGFEKSSSFHRAFKRWTGHTPGQFRKQGAAA